MKNAVLICVTVVAVFGIIFGSISYNTYINRDKVHVYSQEEIFTMECSKRGGNPKTEIGADFSGDKRVGIKEFKCEGVNDVHN